MENKWKRVFAKNWTFFNGEQQVLHIVQTGHDDQYVAIVEDATDGCKEFRTLTSSRIVAEYGLSWDQVRGFVEG